MDVVTTRYKCSCVKSVAVSRLGEEVVCSCCEQPQGFYQRDLVCFRRLLLLYDLLLPQLQCSTPAIGLRLASTHNFMAPHQYNLLVAQVVDVAYPLTLCRGYARLWLHVYMCYMHKREYILYTPSQSMPRSWSGVIITILVCEEFIGESVRAVYYYCTVRQGIVS